MNTVTLSADCLIVEPEGFDRLWSFRSHIEVPLAHVRGATFDPGAVREPKGVRGPGLHVPGKWAGTFRSDGDTTFWNVTSGGDAVVIELADEHFSRLILSVEHPRALVDEINAAVRA